MKTSCIEHPKNESYINIKKWQMEFCEGDPCAAALISFFEYFHNIRLEQQIKSKQANDIAENHGDKRTQDESLYQFYTMEDLQNRLFNIWNRYRIKKAREFLKSKKVITEHRNPNPRYKFDKTLFFLFHPDTLNSHLSNVKKCRTVRKKITDGTKESNVTIPEVTTEVTTDKKTYIHFSAILEHWNKAKIITHRGDPPKSGNTLFKTAAKNILSNYSLPEVFATIDNYSRILNSDKYYFTHRWTLTEFLCRGFEKFVDFDTAHKTYLTNQRKQVNHDMPKKDENGNYITGREGVVI